MTRRIDEQVPEGRTLLAGPVSFAGPCRAVATVPDETVVRVVDTPTLEQPDATQRRRRAAMVELARSDAGMARVVEDLIDVLAAKGVIALGDLPTEVQQRLADRVAARTKLQ
jgi:hypothetical protein